MARTPSRPDRMSATVGPCRMLAVGSDHFATIRETPMKLATFRSAGREKIGLVHRNDSRLFDLAAAADRTGKSNPAFASMLHMIDAGPGALDQASALFDKHGQDEAFSMDVGRAEILAPVPEPRQ